MSGSRRLAVVAMACGCALLGGDKKKPAAYAIVAGTVFRDPGFALPSAKVVLMAQAQPKPKKLQEAVTNYRGEFLFRVPPKEGAYVLRASLKGYHAEDKEAKISGEEHIDVNFVLAPESR